MKRRHLLRAAGMTLALPALESLGFRAYAAEKPAPVPLRLAFLYVPNGVNVAKWDVTGEGRDYQLSPTLEPLAELREHFSVLSGLDHQAATWGSDGPGDHSRATATFLTGCRARKTAGPDIHLGVSADQIAARLIGGETRLPSLELTTDDSRTSGKCDSGYSCAYQYNLSWKTPTQPLAAERNPRAVFDRLFGTAVGANRGVIDAVLKDANDLRRNLNPADRGVLDQYLESVREVERRLERSGESSRAIPDFEPPAGLPDSYREHIRAMFDLIILAFQSDSTRIVTFMLAHDGSNHAFPEIGVPEAHHQLSHHRNDESKLAKIAQIDRFYTSELALFLDRLHQVQDRPGANLLDQSMIIYGSGIKEGNQHTHVDLPVILAGHGAGSLHPGRHIRASEGTPMTNLYLSLLHRMGAEVESIGDSSGEWNEI